MNYRPSPIDTSNIHLDESLRRLVEKTARNIHEVWASKRMAEGWVWGPERNDAAKTHPCLVEYEQLPETERDYDRATVAETLKSVIAQGYRIEPADDRTDDFEYGRLERLGARLESSEPIPLADLREIWETHDPERWSALRQLYRSLAERIIKIGEPLLAYDILSNGLQRFSEKKRTPAEERLWTRLRQLLGLSLAQSGAAARARQVLQDIYDRGGRDGETLGILGRTYKDLAMAENDPEIRARRMSRAFSCYFEAYEIARKNDQVHDAYYTGINAATLSLMIGDAAQAERLARQVLDICATCSPEDGAAAGGASYWIDATIAEARLLLGEFDAAMRCYRTAVQKARDNFRDISAMKRQAGWIAAYAGLDATSLESCFPLPRIGIFGHPHASSGTCVSSEFSERLKDLNIGIGYVSVTGLTDLLFAEAMLALPDTELHMVFPFSISETRHLFETDYPNSDLPGRLEIAAQNATKHYELSYICALGNERNYEFAKAFTTGMATLRGRWMNTDVHFLDGRSLKTEGWATKEAQNRETGAHPMRPADYPAEASRDIYSMMFADVKNYSRLDENQLLLFAHHFMSHTAKVVEPFSSSLVYRRTSGDGFFFVFENLPDALNFALAFRDRIAEIDWTNHGLPASLAVRMSLDAGPIFSYHDKVADHLDFCGKYVIRAARMEPITPPGEIYTSESFAALAVSHDANHAEFAYAGQIRLPKDFGTIPVYHVRRRRP
jgi:class 3 adenylate cyclase